MRAFSTESRSTSIYRGPHEITAKPRISWGLVPVAVDDPASREVVRRELDSDAIAWRDADEVAAHAAGGVGDQLVPALHLDLEHRVRERLRHDRVHDDRLLFLIAVVAVRLACFLWPPRRAPSFVLAQ